VFYRRDATVAQLVRYAFGVSGVQISGGPDWLKKDAFEVLGKVTGDLSDRRVRLMVQALLADRFKLVTHTEPRTMSHYRLVVARPNRTLGPRMTPCDPQNPPPPKSIPLPRGGIVAANACGAVADIALLAANVLGKPVVDETGLTGSWTYDVGYLVPSMADRLDPAQVTALPLPEALREELGLKLESSEGPVDLLVIDSVQPPAEN
jgi:uncharacterized protein (TIGR03435 family)